MNQTLTRALKTLLGRPTRTTENTEPTLPIDLSRYRPSAADIERDEMLASLRVRIAENAPDSFVPPPRVSRVSDLDRLRVAHLDGVEWADAPAPRRLHTCWAQTRGERLLDVIERNGCGAIRSTSYPGYSGWSQRNTRSGSM